MKNSQGIKKYCQHHRSFKICSGCSKVVLNPGFGPLLKELNTIIF